MEREMHILNILDAIGEVLGDMIEQMIVGEIELFDFGCLFT